MFYSLLPATVYGQFQDYAVDVVRTGTVANNIPPNTSGYTASFRVYNNGLEPDTYSLTCTSSANVVCISLSAYSVSPNPGGQYVTVTASYRVTSPGSASIGLQATGGPPNYVTDADQFTFTILNYQVAVTPDGASGGNLWAFGNSWTASFTVQNVGQGSDSYNLTCTTTGPLTCGTISPSIISLAVNAYTTVNVPFSTGDAGSGTLTLTASSTLYGVSDVGSYSYTVTRYGVAVTPDGGSVTHQVNSSQSETFTVQNTGSASNTYSLSCATGGSLSGCSVQSSVTLGASLSQNVTVSYSAGSSSSGTLTLTASSGAGPGVSDGGSYSVNLTGVVVSPATGDVTHPANGGYSETFTVLNNGSVSNTYNLSCAVSGSLSSCGGIPGSVTLGPGASANYGVTYNAGTNTTGTVSLTATGTVSPSVSQTASTLVRLVGVVVTPDGGAVTRNVNASYSETFTVQNIGSESNTFSFACSATGTVTCGGNPASVNLAGGGTSTGVSVSYSVTQAGAGSLTLGATGSLSPVVTDNGSYTITLVGVTVTPDGGASQRTANTSGLTETFTVKHLGSQSGVVYTLNCTATGTVTVTSCPGTTTALNPLGQTNISVTYSVGSGAPGTLTLTASNGASDAGSFNIPLIGVTVTPDGAARTRTANTGPHSDTLVVHNLASSSVTYTLTRTCTGSVTSCSTPSNPTLAAGASTNVIITYSVTQAASGTITLSASGGSASDQGSFNVALVGVTVTPDGQVTAARTVGTTGHKETFTVQNLASSSQTYTVGCSGDAKVTCTGTEKTSATLAAGASTTSWASFNAVATGTGVLTLTASNASASNPGTYNVPVDAASAIAAMDGASVFAFASASNKVRFLVKNTDTGTHTSALAAVCSGSVSGCTVSRTALTLPPMFGDTLYVTYTAGAPGTTGVVKLKADLDSGWANVTAVTDSGPVVSVADANPETVLDRSQCVTIAAGSAAAFECGDLRIVQPLPAIRTLNKTRVPTLLYNSATADPRPLVAAFVTVKPGLTLPDSVEGILRINGVEKGRARWYGQDWGAAGNTRQIVLADTAFNDTTKAFDYTFEVATIYGTSRYSTTANGKLIVVSRKNSAFGAGWWLAGLERLELLPDSTKLWVGGDGSARLYSTAGTGKWVAQAVDRPDTLKWDGAQARFLLVLPHGDTVKFDGAGQHVATVNRLNHVTAFAYASGRLTTITLPSQGGGQTYSFAYDGNNWLQSVTAPQSRTTTMSVSNGRTDWVRDAGGDTVKFAYESGSSKRVTKRTDRRGTNTWYSYDQVKKLWRVKVDLQPDSIRPTFLASLRWGYRPSTDTTVRKARDTASVYTGYYGARYYTPGATGDSIPQYVLFYPDRFGAPRKIYNILGQTTSITRNDAEFPNLVTRTVEPNGRRQVAAYNRRGNVAWATDSSTAVNGVYATARYEWDAKWDFVTKVVPPEKDSTVLAYDATTGNRLWQQDARGTTSRVTFGYFTSGNKSGLLQSADPPVTAAYIYDYDARGNLLTSAMPMGFQTFTYRDVLGRDSLTRVPIDSITGLRWQESQIFWSVMDRVDSTVAFGPALGGIAAESLVVKHNYDRNGNDTLVYREPRGGAGSSGALTTRHWYDRANRDTLTDNDGIWQKTRYDPAGNPKAVTSARGDTTRMTYDALNRLIRRVIPTVTYAQEQCGVGWPAACSPYPLYSNRQDGGLDLTANTDTLSYDVAGNVVRAANQFAWVRRSFNLNGTLKTDTLRIRRYGGTDSTTHVYGLSYTYDLDGRRTSLAHPTALAGGTKTTSYAYTTFGPLSRVTNPLSNRYDFFYDDAGRMDSLSMAHGHEGLTYDGDGRLVARRWVTDSMAVTDTVVYDRRGLATGATNSIGLGGEQWYSGLGHLAEAWFQGYPAPTQIHEQYYPDALGNQLYTAHYDYDMEPPGRWKRQNSYGPGGRFANALGVPADQDQAGDPLWLPDVDSRNYDNSGNQRSASNMRYRATFADDGHTINYVTLREDNRSFYRADQKLMVAQVYRDSVDKYGNTRERYGTYEEYWYDALGRRVLKRVRQDSICAKPQFCYSAMERYVWDGDQLLYELRHQASDGASDAALNVALPTGSVTSQTGSVGYTHGPGLDQPLDVIRGATTVVRPYASWRGVYATGADTLGWQYGCVPANKPGCIDVPYPAGSWGPFLGTDPRKLRPWWGSLIEGKRDATGLLYMRNRYYDPSSGQFTQKDPIGLAGGMNLYGFTGGDPVNFSDPFGLCRRGDADCLKVLAWLREQKGKVFQRAARAFEATTREVHLVPGDQVPLGSQFNRDGNPRTWVGGGTPRDGDEMWLNADFGKGDLLLTAVDEAEHLRGRFHPAGKSWETDPPAFGRISRGYQDLSPSDQASAPLHGDVLYRRTNGRVGMPLPDDYVERKIP